MAEATRLVSSSGAALTPEQRAYLTMQVFQHTIAQSARQPATVYVQQPLPVVQPYNAPSLPAAPMQSYQMFNGASPGNIQY